MHYNNVFIKRINFGHNGVQLEIILYQYKCIN